MLRGERCPREEEKIGEGRQIKGRRIRTLGRESRGSIPEFVETLFWEGKEEGTSSGWKKGFQRFFEERAFAGGKNSFGGVRGRFWGGRRFLFLGKDFFWSYFSF